MDGEEGKVSSEFVSRKFVCTYHVNELHKGEPKAYVDLLRHVLDGSDELVVAAEQIANETLFVLTSGDCKGKGNKFRVID